MDTIRYGLTVLLVCTLPPFLLYWPVVHGFIGFWRQRGPSVTFAVVVGAMLAGAYSLYRVRAHLVVGDFGTSWPLVAGGSCLFAVGVWLRVRIKRDFADKVLVGLPELAPESHPQQLVRSGVYGRIRHPRYVQFFIALGAWAFIANYLSGYVIWLLWIPGVYVLVLFEERELKERFGAEYVQYCDEVPRFIPALDRSRQT